MALKGVCDGCAAGSALGFAVETVEVGIAVRVGEGGGGSEDWAVVVVVVVVVAAGCCVAAWCGVGLASRKTGGDLGCGVPPSATVTGLGRTSFGDARALITVTTKGITRWIRFTRRGCLRSNGRPQTSTSPSRQTAAECVHPAETHCTSFDASAATGSAAARAEKSPWPRAPRKPSP